MVFLLMFVNSLLQYYAARYLDSVKIHSKTHSTHWPHVSVAYYHLIKTVAMASCYVSIKHN